MLISGRFVVLIQICSFVDQQFFLKLLHRGIQDCEIAKVSKGRYYILSTTQNAFTEMKGFDIKFGACYKVGELEAYPKSRAGRTEGSIAPQIFQHLIQLGLTKCPCQSRSLSSGLPRVFNLLSALSYFELGNLVFFLS